MAKEVFARDEVYSNAEGDMQFRRRIFQWIKENEKCYEGNQWQSLFCSELKLTI